MKNRRQVLLSSAALAALAGCQSFPAVPLKVQLPPELAQLVSDVNAVIGTLKKLLPASAELTKAQAITTTLSEVTSLAAAQPLVTALAPIISKLTGLLPTTGTVGRVVSAIETVMPIVLKVAGIVVPLFLRRAETGMTAEEARAVLSS